MIQMKVGLREGRIFEGIGGITSNGMSKLMMDYSPEQLSELMDLLFRPGYGASLQHLKVEIGSDVNTSSGTEPSHMRSKDDLDITRGCGLPLAKLAKEVNPELVLEALRWGTPRWIQNDEDKWLFYLNFLRGARETYGLEFDFIGPDINEGAFDRDWAVNTLGPGLKQEGFGHIRIVADDSEHGWDIADRAAIDKELFELIHAYGVHYTQESTETARSSGKPLWLSEDLASFRHSFSDGALMIARRISDSYTLGRMVRFEIHPLVEAEYENTPYNYKGILVTTWPWSGHYRIDPGLWIIAHYTQFIQPGWVYMDDGCGRSEYTSHVTLQNKDTGDISIVIVNNGPESVMFDCDLTGLPASSRELHVWRTTEAEQFELQSGQTLEREQGKLRLNAVPYSIYTVTTTTGQCKGCSGVMVETSSSFPLPYEDGLSSGRAGANPRHTTDQGGAFEFVSGEMGIYLQQQVTAAQIPVDWTYRRTPEPYTLLGSLEWANYEVSVDVRLESEYGYAMLGGRVNYTDKSVRPPEGYLFIMRHDGGCELRRGVDSLAYGRISEGLLGNDEWHRMKLTFADKTIAAWWNGTKLLEVEDTEISSGQVSLGSGYHHLAYRNLRIEPIRNGESILPVDCSRVIDTDSALLYKGQWTLKKGDFNGFARTMTHSNEEGAILVVRFQGSGISLLGKRAPDGGMADIFLNGVNEGTIDTYAPEAKYRRSLFSKYGLESGRTHELRLVVSSGRNPRSADRQIYADAVEIIGGTLIRNKEDE
ncbi:family 16 glycoside hydrolase [Paenibacillus sp. PAMC21692]|uniref:family 16 glycoside hydrolase n=1 Tax=Paenibacillus sp. PAMC21692 TaxID=2762320 RepID=UPI00164D26C6|nr:family 16 glycoside hydrolase [Paenibacillus sp. PAMC21692]QNK58810.1 hypothetical protein H7F31_08025 [Paenibacillus sp. PAMC21692]